MSDGQADGWMDGWCCANRRKRMEEASTELRKFIFLAIQQSKGWKWISDEEIDFPSSPLTVSHRHLVGGSTGGRFWQGTKKFGQKLITTTTIVDECSCHVRWTKLRKRRRGQDAQ